MQIKRVPIDSVYPDPNNARVHDERNIDAIKGSLVKFGQQKPIVIDAKGIVLAGNGTLEAARAIGWTEIDAVETALAGFDAMAYALADNKTSELGKWNEPVLASTLLSLQKLKIDTESLGFDTVELALDPSYEDLEDEADPDFDSMRAGVRKAVQIEFKLSDYEEAFALIKFFRDRSDYIGGMLMEHLRSEKDKLTCN